MITTIIFRIRRMYLDDIMAGTKTAEVRRVSPYWTTEVAKVERALSNKQPVLAIFFCGRKQCKRLIESVKRYDTAREALGREPSEQGRKDIGEGPVYRFNLGRTI